MTSLPPCEHRNTPKGSNCGHPSTVFAMGHSSCAAHAPKGSPNCSHSLGIERCAYCGAPASTWGGGTGSDLRKA